jgi:hypothetical protein
MALAAPNGNARTHRPRVMVLDRERTILEVRPELLQFERPRVAAAAFAPAALAQIEALRPDLLIIGWPCANRRVGACCGISRLTR